jgi:glycine/serine hydroxymethyltransferase
MTRFGMGAGDFAEIARLMAAAILEDADVAADVVSLRAGFRELGYCFNGPQFDPIVQRLHRLL